MNADRRSGDRPAVRPRPGGRRWVDDPDLKVRFEDLMVGLSEHLHAKREGLGWSLEQAAVAAGVAPQTVLDIEKTRGDPHLSTVMRLFFVYGEELVVAGRPAVQPPTGAG